MTMVTSKPAPAGTLRYLHDLIVKKDPAKMAEMVETMPEPWQALWRRILNGFAYCDKKEYGPEALNDFLLSDESPVLEHSDASTFIEQLRKLPWHDSRNVSNYTPVTEEGMYRRVRECDATIYKVQRAVHGSCNLYAKKLVVTGSAEYGNVKVTFVYAPGALKGISAEDKLSYADAKAFGALYGTCCRCGRTLTHELSIALGIGPVCGRREFGGDFEQLIEKAKLEVASK
jgi:hypothetical protein